jgi:hypothetical protein
MGISLSTKRDKIQHAKHNKDACEHIGKVQNFPDWMITTAFYSALHYIDSKLFPVDYTLSDGKKIKCSSLDIYCSLKKKDKGDVPVKHELRKELVRQLMNEDISNRFSRLSDASSTARYRNYEEYTFRQAQEFYNDLCAIEKFCGGAVPATAS